jgi:hypothetical protein
MTEHNTPILPTQQEKAQMALILANKLRSKALFDDDITLHDWSNLMWAVAYKTGVCTIKYHKLNGTTESFIELRQTPYTAFISSHDVKHQVFEDIINSNPINILSFNKPPGYKHPATKINPQQYQWEDLFPEFVFLSLSYKFAFHLNIHTFEWDTLFNIVNIKLEKRDLLKTLPENPISYTKNKQCYQPLTDPKHYQWVNFREWRFKTWINIAPIFE